MSGDLELSWCADEATRAEWRKDSSHWRGHVMTGRYAHWCSDWDDLPIDEHSPEWPCVCSDDLVRFRTPADRKEGKDG